MAAIRPEAYIAFIKSAVVLSVRERMHSPKRFVYEVQVEWSNDAVTTSYRGYTDFFDFQCELIRIFPFEGGTVKGVERTLPYLPGRKIFQRRTAALAEKRLPEIDNYVKSLVVMPDHISRCEKVLQFFRSNWQEDRLRRGSFSLPGRQPSSTSSNSALMFHEEGAVEYSVKSLSEDAVFRDSSPSPTPPPPPPLQDESNAIHPIQEVEGEGAREGEREDRESSLHFENPTAKTGLPTQTSTHGTTL